MKNLFFAALFAIVATAPALASELQPEPELAGYTASDSVSNTSGAVVQVGKFFGSLLKLPVAVGRDLVVGIRSGLTDTTGASATGSSDTVSMAPVENRTTPEFSGVSVSKSSGSACKVCGGSGPSKASTTSKSKVRSASYMAKLGSGI